MSVLLTDEAMRAAIDDRTDRPGPVASLRVLGVEAFLRYHATEGREALVVRIQKVYDAERFKNPADYLAPAEAVVTALFGEAV